MWFLTWKTLGALTSEARAEDRVAEKIPAEIRGPKPDTRLITWTTHTDTPLGSHWPRRIHSGKTCSWIVLCKLRHYVILVVCVGVKVILLHCSRSSSTALCSHKNILSRMQEQKHQAQVYQNLVCLFPGTFRNCVPLIVSFSNPVPGIWISCCVTICPTGTCVLSDIKLSWGFLRMGQQFSDCQSHCVCCRFDSTHWAKMIFEINHYNPKM